MKLSLELEVESPKEWIDAVLLDFPAFLQDHADCERKASAMSMSLVAKYPDRTAIIPELIETAVEELEHFQQVYNIMQQKGIQLQHELKQDMYIKGLLALMNSGLEERFLDRLLLASVIECRGAERFRIVYEHVEDPEIKQFYHNLWASEAKHGNIFVKMALEYFEEEKVYERLTYLNAKEGEVLLSLPFRAALH